MCHALVPVSAAHTPCSKIKHQAGIADQRRQLTALLRTKVQRRIRKTITGDETKRVRDHIREPRVARRIDATAFTLGVLNLIVSEFVLVRFPQVGGWSWGAWLCVVHRVYPTEDRARPPGTIYT